MMSRTRMDPFQSFAVVRVDARCSTPAADRVATELPLEVRLEGYPFSVIMRTPGADEDLAVGFLFSESVIRNAGEIRRIERGESADVINIRLSRDRAEILPELLGLRRQVTTNSSCGMCGRRSLESLTLSAPPLTADWAVQASLVTALPAILRDVQRAFDETGGLHAAGLFDTSGRLELSAEDVGRHNAVDKLLGRMVLAGRVPLDRTLLFVSGRSSFEIVQKAFLGGIPFVAAVSAPSSMAVTLARSAGLTLLGFVRDDRFNIYAHEHRVKTNELQSGLGSH
jgi:FdhD protein